MAQDLAEEFRSTLREGLRPLKDSLITVFRQLVEYDYPPEVVAFAFEDTRRGGVERSDTHRPGLRPVMGIGAQRLDPSYDESFHLTLVAASSGTCRHAGENRHPVFRYSWIPPSAGMTRQDIITSWGPATISRYP